ncbi:MAG: DUF1273 family protein [Firmicutes bacterium]|nr:DUF1273 family protein [Bacillota bacterium]
MIGVTMRTCAMIAGRNDVEEVQSNILDHQIPILYYDFGVRKILCGVHKGRELGALDYILNEKNRFPNLKIHGVFTHEEEANLWNEKDREKLYHAIRFCDEEWILKPVYGNEMRFQRNIVMMDRCDIVFLLGRDREIEFWAAKMKKPIIRVDTVKNRLIPSVHLYRKSER